MADKTKIEWTDATWNPITGCSVTSPGCKHCYAMRLAGTRLRNHPSRRGLTTDTENGPVWNGDLTLNEGWLDRPLHWTKPRMIFVCAHGDLFHEHVPEEWIDQVFAVMALAPQHTFQVLTKRAKRMRDYLAARKRPNADELYRLLHGPLMRSVERTMQGAIDAIYPLPNVWLGVSVEDQARADERIPHLLATPAAVRWISAEPLLGPIDLRKIAAYDALAGTETRTIGQHNAAGLWDQGDYACLAARIDWVVVGGESGAGARPMHPDWARSIRNQCVAAGAPFLFKQWGEWAPGLSGVITAQGPRESQPDVAWPDGTIAWGDARDHGGNGVDLDLVGKKVAGRLLDGVEHSEFPAVRP